jgi:type VI protein secretion system component VasK
MSRLRSCHHPIYLPLGLVIWSLWFVTLYGGLSVACQVAPPAAEQGARNSLNLALLAGSLLTAALLACLTWLFWRAGQRARREGQAHYVATTAAAVNLVATLAVLFITLPILWMPPCL